MRPVTALGILRVRTLALGPYSRWFVASAVVVAGACAPISHSAVGGPITAFDQQKLGLEPVEPEKVFSFGYGIIHERYLTAVGVASLALNGMQGFSAIDPKLAVTLKGDTVAVAEGEQPVAEYHAPAEDDADGWARLTVRAARDARAVSQPMRDADDERLYEAAFDATLGKLDPFSRYAGAKEAREHRASRNGFGGIGIRFDLTGGAVVISEVMPDAPAGRAAIQVGDRITAIDGQAVDGLGQEDLSKRLRGAIASDIILTLKRPDAPDPFQVPLKRALVVPPTVTMTVDQGIADIKVTSFNQRTASTVTQKLREAKASLGTGLKGVMLDLRGNPGGLLDQAVAVADLFMSGGKIVYTEGRHPRASQSYDASPGDLGEDVKLVVLVDGKSASASEIVAAALQDSGRAVVVGTNSFGKGTVQTVIRMPNDGEMTLTWSRFHGPSGYALHGLGVLPTICTAAEHTDPHGLLEGVRAGSDDIVRVELAEWRATTIEEADLRTKLRTNCPAAKHEAAAGIADVDADLARSLLADGALFTHALALSTPVLTAHASAH